MTLFRNFIDQLLDGAAKKKLEQTCKLVREEFRSEVGPLGTEEDFFAAHDALISELSKVGRATENCGEIADFSFDRHVGDRSDIGIVCDRHSAKIILAVRSAQKRFSQPYPVRLDCDEAEITILCDGRVFGSSNEEMGDKLLKRFGL